MKKWKFLARSVQSLNGKETIVFTMRNPLSLCKHEILSKCCGSGNIATPRPESDEDLGQALW